MLKRWRVLRQAWTQAGTVNQETTPEPEPTEPDPEPVPDTGKHDEHPLVDDRWDGEE